MKERLRANLTKGRSRYTRIWYTLSLVNFDRFRQHFSITDADEICDMAAVRDLSTSDAVFKSVINNKLSKEWKSRRRLHDNGGLLSSRGHKERPS